MADLINHKTDRLIGIKPPSVRPVGCERGEYIAHADDSRSKGNLITLQVRRIAGTVEVLVVVPDRLENQRVVISPLREDVIGQHRVHADVLHFLDDKRTDDFLGPVQIIGEPELSYIVKQSGEREPVDDRFVQIQLPREVPHETADEDTVFQFFC